MSLRRALILASVAGLAVAIGLALSGAGDHQGFVSPPIDWTPCAADVECGDLEVPIDHADPSAGTIRLAVARRPAQDSSRRLGVLLFVPGGPGYPGTPVVESGFLFSSALSKRFDLVSWDPRGVSRGTEIRCVDDREELLGDVDPTPETEAELADVSSRARAFADGCKRRGGPLLAHVSTVSSAKDIDLLRGALGEEQLSLLGQSYGTALGSVYATLYPRRVRAAVLDGAYDLGAPYDRQLVQAVEAQARVLASMLRWCARDDLCPFHGSGDPASALDRLLARLDTRPLAAGGEVVSLADALGAVRFGLYSERGWRTLAYALDSALLGDGSALLRLAEPAGLPATDSGIATVCLDRPRGSWGASDSAIDAALESSGRFGRYLIGHQVHLCDAWPVDPEPPPPITARRAGPLLVVGSTGDVATPLAASRDLARHLEDASLLVVKGNHHTSYFDVPERECVTRVVDRYLIELALPASGSVCGAGDAMPRSP